MIEYLSDGESELISTCLKTDSGFVIAKYNTETNNVHFAKVDTTKEPCDWSSHTFTFNESNKVKKFYSFDGVLVVYFPHGHGVYISKDSHVWTNVHRLPETPNTKYYPDIMLSYGAEIKKMISNYGDTMYACNTGFTDGRMIGGVDMLDCKSSVCHPEISRHAVFEQCLYGKYHPATNFYMVCDYVHHFENFVIGVKETTVDKVFKCSITSFNTKTYDPQLLFQDTVVASYMHDGTFYVYLEDGTVRATTNGRDFIVVSESHNLMYSFNTKLIPYGGVVYAVQITRHPFITVSKNGFTFSKRTGPDTDIEKNVVIKSNTDSIVRIEADANGFLTINVLDRGDLWLVQLHGELDYV